MDYKKLTVNYKDEMLKNLSKFVAIDSVYDDETRDSANPFGKGVSDALAFIAEVAKKDGFEVTNYDNMVVEIIAGKGDKNITIMAHADVVPEGTGWDQDPFEVVEKDGVLYGRGVADDKGPLLSCYYGLKALKDNNLLGDYQVRFLVGGNEESGSLGIEHYFQHLKKAQPTLGFSPDSSYPLIYGEKEITGFEVKTTINVPQIISIHAGVAANSVIERCEALVEKDEELISYLKEMKVSFDVEDLGDNMLLVFHGKAAHGSIPWMGDNAGMHCLEHLGQFYANEELILLARYYTPTKGEGIGANAYSEEMGDNSLNVGIINMEDGDISLIVNFRYTNAVTREGIQKTIIENSKPFSVEFKGISPLLYYPKDSVLVSTLLDVYQQETGDFDTPPLTTGGGTYAKEADNVIAFGMEYPGWDAHMHSPGECIKIDHLVESMAIYAHAIIELGKKL